MDANQKGMGDVKRFVKHWFAWIRESDEGSGTISGVALIAVAAIMLSAVASAGNLLLCLHRPSVGGGGQRAIWRLCRPLLRGGTYHFR